MSIYRILSALLRYPEPELIAALPEIKPLLPAQTQEQLQPLLDWLEATPCLEAQQEYVATFDRNPRQSLHIFEHVHGESRDRGMAMVNLIEEYRKWDVTPVPDELPDYVPLFLEFLGMLPPEEAERLLLEAIHVLAALGERLGKHASPYQGIFTVLVDLAGVTPEPLPETAVHDMDEMLETDSPSPDGAEPLLRPDKQVITFHGRGAGKRPIPATQVP